MVGFLAQAAAPSAGGAGAASPFAPFIPMVLMVVIFYFVLLRPQQQKTKKQLEMQKALKSGDRITTATGIIGVVVSVKENTVTLRSGDSKLEMTKASVTDLLAPESSSAS